MFAPCAVAVYVSGTSKPLPRFPATASRALHTAALTASDVTVALDTPSIAAPWASSTCGANTSPGYIANPRRFARSIQLNRRHCAIVHGDRCRDHTFQARCAACKDRCLCKGRACTNSRQQDTQGKKAFFSSVIATFLCLCAVTLMDKSKPPGKRPGIAVRGTGF